MKRLGIVLLVLVLASSSVFAFQGWDLFGKDSSVKSAEPSPVQQKAEASKKAIAEVQGDLQEKLTQKEADSSENVQSETSNQLKSVVEEYSEASKLNKAQMMALMDKLNVVADDIDLLIADNLAKDYEINRMKFFANGGIAVGFASKDDKILPRLGVTGNFGVKFSNGIQVGTGVQYMLCEIGKPEKKMDFTWGLDRLSFTATCGYEW